MNKATEFTTISICVDHVWAGDGKLIDGVISDCGAQFGADQDESENVYELIEEAIEEGKGHLKVELSDRDDSVLITWSIVEPASTKTISLLDYNNDVKPVTYGSPDEDYCDVNDVIGELNLWNLQGTVNDGRWEWDGNGEPTDLRGNSILNIKAI